MGNHGQEVSMSGDWAIFLQEDAFYRETTSQKLGTVPFVSTPEKVNKNRSKCPLQSISALSS
jgi:hypothetical protein